MALGNLSCDNFKGKTFYPIEWRQVIQVLCKSFYRYLLFLLHIHFQVKRRGHFDTRFRARAVRMSKNSGHVINIVSNQQ